MADYIWYLTPITRDSGSDPTWDTGTSVQLKVWFGTTAPADPSLYDIVIIDDDNTDGLVDSPELREALQAYDPTLTLANNSAFFGLDGTTSGVPSGTVATVAFTDENASIETATTGFLISLEPVTNDEITAEFKAGVGNFPGFDPGSLVPPCFARGTLIETPDGPRAVESLAVGDLVLTVDNGAKPILWIGSNRVSAQQLDRQPELRPIRIRQGALGEGQPTRDLIVSPQHRILVRSRIAQKMFGTDEVLVAAKQLCQIEGIDIAADLPEVEYFHFLFDQHEVVVSNGARTESLYVGPMALKGVGPAARDEILKLFPELRDGTTEAPGARPLVSGRMGRKLTIRHIQNERPLIETR